MFRVWFLSFNIYGLINLEFVLIVNSNLHVECHNVTFLRFKINSLCSFEVFFCLKNFEIMVILLGVKSEPRLILFNCDTKSDQWSEHHH